MQPSSPPRPPVQGQSARAPPPLGPLAESGTTDLSSSAAETAAAGSYGLFILLLVLALLGFVCCFLCCGCRRWREHRDEDARRMLEDSGKWTAATGGTNGTGDTASLPAASLPTACSPTTGVGPSNSREHPRASLRPSFRPPGGTGLMGSVINVVPRGDERRPAQIRDTPTFVTMNI